MKTIRIKCAKCLEVLEMTDEFQTCSCHLILIRAKNDQNANDWRSRIVGKPEHLIILEDDE